MAYIDKQYMIDRFGTTNLIDLTDREEPYSEAINDQILERALAAADGLIDSYISKRYKTPASPVPEILKTVAANIAYFHLHYGGRYDEAVEKSYTKAESYLKDIAMGRADLSVDGLETASSVGDAHVEAPPRIFSRDSLKGF